MSDTTRFQQRFLAVKDEVKNNREIRSVIARALGHSQFEIRHCGTSTTYNENIRVLIPYRSKLPRTTSTVLSDGTVVGFEWQPDMYV